MSFVPFLLGQLALVFPFLLLSHFVWFYVQSPLKNIPGPFLAKFTNIWRLMNQLTRRSHRTQIWLHERHGSAVRLGPNLVSLSDPSLIKVVYDVRGNYIKVRPSIPLQSSLSLLRMSSNQAFDWGEVERLLCDSRRQKWGQTFVESVQHKKQWVPRRSIETNQETFCHEQRSRLWTAIKQNNWNLRRKARSGFCRH